ncbi:unnamed protein product [Leptosia nina]|uniref:Luciferin 4-monooxygenase n=1 Tax=Leptosia nina TaxID=320188 RepID=A0AAV1JHG2_9NEOP
MFKNPKYVYGNCECRVLATLHFGEEILKRIRAHQDNVALINGATDETLTYASMAQEAINLAVSLKHLNVRKGDVIAICSENRREFWSTVIGIFCTGAVVTAINTTYSKDEMKHVLGISKPKYIFCSPSTYKQHSKSFKSIEKIIIYGDERFSNTIAYNDLAVANVKNKVLRENVKYDDFMCVDVNGQTDVGVILYSSGTTGLPKGVMLTHLNVLAACTPMDGGFVTKSLAIAPWYHSMGLISTMRQYFMGSTIVYLPKFEVELYLKTIETYKILSLAVSPPVLVAISKFKSKYDLSSVATIHCGAAPLYEETANAATQIFPNLQGLFQGYGLTETTLALTFSYNSEKSGSVGGVVDNAILKIVNPETKEVLGPNQEGEIYAKGVSVMKGYIGRDRKLDFDDEGFFRTGDVGYYDEDRYFYIVDRLKELIKYKGYQVPPAEIEAVLLKHSGIRDAGVIGVRDLLAGELPLAFVALQPGVQLTEKEIQDYVAERLSNPKHLRGGVRFLPEIPKNPSGKILRKELRKLVKSPKSKI